MEVLSRRVLFLYVWTLALGTVHVVDSAYWHEWEVLGLPGGIQLFLVESLILAVPFLYGLAKLARGTRSGPVYGIVLSLVGIAGFGIHAFLLLRGGTEFRNTASLATIFLMFVFSVGLLLGSIRLQRAALSSESLGMRDGPQ
jgi:hypothetical protein